MGTVATLPDRTKPGWIETFAAGQHPGDKPGEVWEYTAEDMAAIAANFRTLSTGDKPLHKVPVVETHDGRQALGWVAKARPRGEFLDTKWAHVVPALVQAIRHKRFDKVSAEIRKDFTDRHGKVYPGPYLYRVAVLGADVPRVKGMADLSQSFADTAATAPGRWVTRPLHFADPTTTRATTMDRNSATKFLTDMGIDPSAITADVPDAFLIAVATAWSAEETGEGDGTGGNGGGNMGDGAGGTGTGTGTGTGNPQPKKVTVSQTYSDPRSIRKLVAHEVRTATASALKTLNDAAAAEAAAREQRAAQERQGAVRIFCDAKAREGKLTPAENDEAEPTSVRARLLREAGQPQAVRTFADPKDPAKKIEKTELALQQDEIEARPARKFSERIPQGGTQGEGAGQRTETGASTEYAAATKAYWSKRAERQRGANGTGAK